MIDASDLHDALRAEGLVPEGEDVHLLACSNKWRFALQRAADAIEIDEDLVDHVGCFTQADLDREIKRAVAEDKATDLEKQLEIAMARVADLERSLEVAEEQLKEAEESE